MELVTNPENFLGFLQQTWHWSVSGALIATVMFLLLLFNKSFGMSANLRTMCTLAGAGKRYKFFNFNWESQKWNLAFLGGTVLGGLIASTLLANPDPVQVSEATLQHLQSIGAPIPEAGEAGFIPEELFNFEALLSLRGLVLIVLGGLLIGFGARWAGGCTSGHAITGLANMQLPSLIAVIGFFIGGLLMTHLLLPMILAIGG
jgi:uncharacterized membrane protein YedE/YeeE